MTKTMPAQINHGNGRLCCAGDVQVQVQVLCRRGSLYKSYHETSAQDAEVSVCYVTNQDLSSNRLVDHSNV